MGKLNMRAGVGIVITIFLSGCPAGSMEGQFLPACPVYEGDSISLSNGRYEWDKFTDMVQVDTDGTKVDQYPEHPQTGSYKIDGKRLDYLPDAGKAPFFVHILSFEEQVFLLTDEQLAEWQRSGKAARCALVLQHSSGN